MLLNTNLPLSTWADAVSHANWIRNRLPNSRIDMAIPFELWYGHKPNLSNLLMFGAPGYAFEYKSDTAKQKKLAPRVLYSHFVVMESPRSLLRLYVPSRKLIILCRVADCTPLKDNNALPGMSSILEGIARQRELTEMEYEPAAADEAKEQMMRCMYTMSTHESSRVHTFKTKARDPRVPTNFKAACRHPHWAAAIDREYDALVRRQTRKVIPLEKGMTPLPFTWNFRIKEDAGDNVPLLYNARCCLRGDKQIPFDDLDPNTLYAPVVRHETIRMLLAEANAQDLIVEGADVDNAYLYGKLETPFIMELPTNSTGIPCK